MDMGAVEGEVKTIVAGVLNVKFPRITAYADFVVNLEADSLKIMDIIMDIEKKFNITVPSKDVGKIKNLAQTVEYITEAINKQKKLQ